LSYANFDKKKKKKTARNGNKKLLMLLALATMGNNFLCPFHFEEGAGIPAFL
jgi:hypothetical protein